jgi:hypothetical protein
MMGLMALGAGPAQAETGAYWLVGGKKISEGLLPTLGATAENNDITFLNKISNKNLHLLCTSIELQGAHLVEPNGGFLGSAKFSGCKFLELLVGGGTKEVKACNPEGGVLTTYKMKGLVTLHGGAARLTLTPFEGTAFISFFLGVECGYGEKLTIGGKLVLKDLVIEKDCTHEFKDEFLVDKVTHLLEADSVLTKLWVNSETIPATLDGSLNISLSGAHEGLTWAGHPA